MAVVWAALTWLDYIGNGLKLCHRFRLGIRKKFFIGMLIKQWNRLPREVMDSPSLEMFEEHVDIAREGTV